MRVVALGVALAICSLSLTGRAGETATSSPQAATRTYASNYKDMVLAACVARAYRHDVGAAIDAGSSVSALRDWTYFDLDKSPDAVESLLDSYLARDYSNPLVESEIQGVKFDLLKCLDLYHSKALEDLVKQMVMHPKRTTRRDNPAAK